MKAPAVASCSSTPRLEVDGSNSLFNDNRAAELQQIVDAALAELRRECPDIARAVVVSKNGKSERLVAARRGWDVTGRGRATPPALAAAVVREPPAPAEAPAEPTAPTRASGRAAATTNAPSSTLAPPLAVSGSAAPRYRDPRLPSVESAKGTGGKCEALLEWLGRLSREYTQQDFTRGVYGRLEPLAVNLFRDESFLQVFGQRYDQASVSWRADVYREVIGPCYGVHSGTRKPWSRSPNRDYVQAFHPYRTVLDRAFQGGPGALAPENISRAIQQRREERRWMDAALARAFEGPATLEAIEQLTNDVTASGQRLSDLWPSEQEFFRETMEARRGALAAVVVEQWAATLDAPRETLADAKALVASKGQLDAAFSALDAARREPVMARYHERLDAVLAPLAVERTARLAGMPETLAGAQQASQWQSAFASEFADMPSRPPLEEARRAGAQRRVAILEAAMPEWQASVESKVDSKEDLQAAARELNTLFPTPQERALPIYRQYQQRLLTMLEEQRRKEAEARAAANPAPQPRAVTPPQGQGLPPPPAQETGRGEQARPSSSDTGIIFPALVNALYDNDFDAIPDDQNVRGYMVAMFKGFNEKCGEGPSNVAFAAMEYGFPQYRRAQENPFSVLGDLMQAMVSMRDQGLRGMESYANQNAVLLQEGLEDARTLAVTYKCNSWTTRAIRQRLGELMQQRRSVRPAPPNRQRFVSLMHPRYREIMGIETPAAVQPTRAERLISACMDWMTESAATPTRRTEFCRCLTDGAMNAGLSDSDLGMLELSFSNDTLREIGQRSPSLLKNTSGCYR